MPRIYMLITVVGLVGLVAAATPGPPRGALSPLSVGQVVTLKEVGGGYQINVSPGLPAGHKVTEVGADFVVVEDPIGSTEIRIPVTSVRAVVVTRALQVK